MKKRKIGAPKGGRVHWLLWELNKEFKSKYLCSYDYALHRYCFYRMDGRSHRLYDVFLVVRTSRRCFRVTYYNVHTNYSEYLSCTKPSMTAHRMYYIYKIHGEIEKTE